MCRGPDRPAAERPAIRSARIELPPRVAAQLRQVSTSASKYVVRGVVESADGAAIAGARVTARTFDRERIAATTTGDDGRFELVVREGDVMIEAEAPGFARDIDYLRITGAHDKRFQLVAAAALRGRVVRDDGVPCAGAKLLVKVEIAGGLRHHTQFVDADASGAFALANLPPGDVEVTAHGVGCVTTQATQLVLAVAEKHEDVTVRAARGYAVSGIVVDARTGEPVAGAQVQGRWQERPRDRLDHTDAQGRFVILGFPAGETAVVARTDDLEGTVIAAIVDRDVEVKIAIAPPEETTEPEVAEPPRKLIDARLDLIEATGAPVALTRVTLSFETGEQREAVSDAKGIVKLQGIPRGALASVTVEGRRWIEGPETAEVIFYTPYQRITLRPVDDGPTASIRGRVIDPDGRPVANVFISTYTPGAPSIDAVSRADGSFETSTAWDATHELIATSADAQLTATVRAQPGETITIQLARRHHVTLRVTRDGRAVNGFSISCQNTDGWISTSMHAGRLRSLEAGPLTCHVVAEEGSGEGSIVVAHGAPNVLAIPLAANATITGRLVSRTGKPLANRELSAHGRNFDVVAETDASGRFVVTGMPAGKAELRFENEPIKTLTAAPGARLDTGDVPVP